MQVYLVTGGEHNGGLASTELLTHGASAWVTVDTGALPSSRRAVRAATLDNRVLLTGGRRLISKYVPWLDIMY